MTSLQYTAKKRAYLASAENACLFTTRKCVSWHYIGVSHLSFLLSLRLPCSFQVTRVKWGGMPCLLSPCHRDGDCESTGFFILSYLPEECKQVIICKSEVSTKAKTMRLGRLLQACHMSLEHYTFISRVMRALCLPGIKYCLRWEAACLRTLNTPSGVVKKEDHGSDNFWTWFQVMSWSLTPKAPNIHFFWRM